MATFPPGRGEPRLGVTREDEQTAANVRRALSENLELQMHPLQVIVCEGEVELRGEVPNAELRQLAAQLAMSAPGVRNVVNHIVVAGDRD